MYPGQPIKLNQLLPSWLQVDEFYVGLAAAALLLCGYAVYSTFKQRDHLSLRIKGIQERRKELRGEAFAPRKRKKRPEGSLNFVRKVVTKLKLLKNTQIGKTENILIEAGFRTKDAIYVLTFFNVVLPVVLGIAGFVIMQIDFGFSSKMKILDYLWPVCGIYFGMKFPWMFVYKARKKRYSSIQKALSDVLDLMTICAEAGLSLAAMLDRVSRELAISYPIMAEELSLTAVEMGFLPDRNKALLNLAGRCQLPEIRGITSVLIQTEKYGTPIAQALRVLSAEFRQARMLRAEQKAARLPAMMTVPMIVCILPTLFIVIIAPAIVKLLDTIK